MWQIDRSTRHHSSQSKERMRHGVPTWNPKSNLDEPCRIPLFDSPLFLPHAAGHTKKPQSDWCRRSTCSFPSFTCDRESCAGKRRWQGHTLSPTTDQSRTLAGMSSCVFRCMWVLPPKTSSSPFRRRIFGRKHYDFLTGSWNPQRIPV